MKDLLQELDNEHLYGRCPSHDHNSFLSLDSVSLATTPRNENSPTVSNSPNPGFPPNYFNDDFLINSGLIDLPDSISEADNTLDLTTPRPGAITNPLYPPNLQDFIISDQLKHEQSVSPASDDHIMVHHDVPHGAQSQASKVNDDDLTRQVNDFVCASESDVSLPSVPSYFSTPVDDDLSMNDHTRNSKNEDVKQGKPFDVVEALERIRNSFYGASTASRDSIPPIKSSNLDKCQQTLALPFRLAVYLSMDINNNDIQRNLRSRSSYYYDFTKRETPYNIGIQCDRELADYRIYVMQQRKSRRLIDRETQRHAKLMAKQVKDNILCRS